MSVFARAISSFDEARFESRRTAIPRKSDGLNSSGLLKSRSRVTIARSFFLTAPFDQVGISRPAKFLLWHGCGIVADCLKYRHQGLAEILVEFELQCLASVGISTNRSRAISAPYAMQARTSASSRPG